VTMAVAVNLPAPIVAVWPDAHCVVAHHDGDQLGAADLELRRLNSVEHVELAAGSGKVVLGDSVLQVLIMAANYQADISIQPADD